jgi:PTS system nitrogen regulatory IIA component
MTETLSPCTERAHSLNAKVRNNGIIKERRMSVELTDIFNEDSIVQLTCQTKDALIGEMADIMADRYNIGDASNLKTAFRSREALMSTGIGQGIAVPHIRIKDVESIVAIMGIAPEGISDYGSMDDEPVKIVVMIAAGKGQHGLYIQFLAKIVAFLKREPVRQKILSQPSAETVFSLMRGHLQGA